MEIFKGHHPYSDKSVKDKADFKPSGSPKKDRGPKSRRAIIAGLALAIFASLVACASNPQSANCITNLEATEMMRFAQTAIVERPYNAPDIRAVMTARPLSQATRCTGWESFRRNGKVIYDRLVKTSRPPGTADATIGSFVETARAGTATALGTPPAPTGTLSPAEATMQGVRSDLLTQQALGTATPK